MFQTKKCAYFLVLQLVERVSQVPKSWTWDEVMKRREKHFVCCVVSFYTKLSSIHAITVTTVEMHRNTHKNAEGEDKTGNWRVKCFWMVQRRKQIPSHQLFITILNVYVCVFIYDSTVRMLSLRFIQLIGYVKSTYCL